MRNKEYKLYIEYNVKLRSSDAFLKHRYVQGVSKKIAISSRKD